MLRCLNSPGFSRASLAGLLIATALLTVSHVSLGETAASAADYDRPSAATIRDETADILKDARFQQRQSLGQWLAEKFGNWNVGHIGGGWVTVVLKIIGIWCVLALLAVLGHLIWTTIQAWPSRRGRSLLGARGTGLDGLAPFEVSWAAAGCAADSGDYPKAASFLMAAALRWLGDRDIVHLHTGKTNGDYVREYSRKRPSRKWFQRLTLGFDLGAYGRRECGAREFNDLRSTFEGLRDNVQREQ